MCTSKNAKDAKYANKNAIMQNMHSVGTLLMNVEATSFQVFAIGSAYYWPAPGRADPVTVGQSVTLARLRPGGRTRTAALSESAVRISCNLRHPVTSGSHSDGHWHGTDSDSHWRPPRPAAYELAESGSELWLSLSPRHAVPGPGSGA